jgi:DNA-binding response OmpR family regulator
MVEFAPPPWVALSGTEVAGGLAAASAIGRLQVVGDPAAFELALGLGRRHLAVLVAPPATEDDERLALRERARRPGLRIVHVTSPTDIERRLNALRRGFDEAFASDIDPDEFVSRLQILDARSRARPGREIPVTGDVVMDPVAHEVRRDGALVHLRPKEFQLLAMLAAHPGRAYTRRQLLDRVWGPDHEGDPRTVDVHVRWLRAKLEPMPATPVHLVTVRGVGYRLDPARR